MSSTRTATLPRAAFVAVLALLALLAAGLGPARADAATPVTTVVSLAITPAGPVRTDTPVTYLASVSPATAKGRVLFTFEQNGTAIAYADCVDGASTVQTKLHQLGTQLVTAQFVPDNPADFAASTSATVPLVITMTPTISLATSTGSVLTSGSHVGPAQQLQALIAGFVPGSVASVSFDERIIVPSIVVGGNTRGSAPFIVPVGLAVGSHLVVARSGALTASVQVVVTAPGTVVVVPVPGTSSTPPATPAPTATPGPTSSAGIPDTGTTPSLAQTGGDPLDLSLGALLLVGVGLLLLRVQPAYGGAHSRVRASHAAGAGTKGRHGAR